MHMLTFVLIIFSIYSIKFEKMSRVAGSRLQINNT